jgi:hypothetical protein
MTGPIIGARDSEDVMRVMVLANAAGASGHGLTLNPELRAKLEKYDEELNRAGVFLAAERLRPLPAVKLVRFAAHQGAIIDEPTDEGRAALTSFWLWQVRTIEEAVEWVRRGPFVDTEVEIRPVMEGDIR